jgi:hypothetical protein
MELAAAGARYAIAGLLKSCLEFAADPPLARR